MKGFGFGVAAIQMILLFCYLKYCKMFIVYEDRLLLKAPNIFFLNDQRIDFYAVKKIIFKSGSKGANTMIVVYESRTIKYRFWEQYGIDVCEMSRALRSRNLDVELKSWNCS